MYKRQGCILAPSLFNLFLADLPPALPSSGTSPPSLNGVPVPILYADDAVLLSITKPGLRLLLSSFQEYCFSNELLINPEKTKILVFSKSWAPTAWKIGNLSFQQVQSFKYLGITFHSQLSWTHHRKAAISSVMPHLNAVARFHFSSGNQYIPAALHIFQIKTLFQLLYGAPIWIEAANQDLDKVAASFLRRILGVPNLIRLSTLILELGMHLPSTIAWSLTFKFWLRLHLNTQPDSILNDLLKDPFSSKWFNILDAKLASLDLSPESLSDTTLHRAHQIIKSKLWQQELNLLLPNLNPICSPHFFGLSPSLGRPSNYFSKLINPSKRRAFMLARLNIFPSAVHFGRFANIPRINRLCLFCSSEPDTLDHILFRCPTHQHLRNNILEPLLSSLFVSLADPLPTLLSDYSATITSVVADFLLAVSKSKPLPHPPPASPSQFLPSRPSFLVCNTMT